MRTNSALYADVHACRRCPLHQERGAEGQAVPAEVGPGYAPGGMAVMCEAPGYYENRVGRPLVGPAGKTFDALLAAAGLRRSDLLVMHRVRCRPGPANRIQDYPEALSACDHWCAAEATTYDPALVVLMGATALQAIFGAQAKVTTTRGSFSARSDRHSWRCRTYTATYHPSAAARSGGAAGAVGQLIVRDLEEAQQVWNLLREGVSA